MPERFHGVQFADQPRAKANLALIEERLPAKLRGAFPTLLAQVPDPDGALNYLERYLRDDGRDDLDSTLRYIERNPAALHYLLLVFSYSRFLSETLVQQPGLAEWLHRPTRTRTFRGGIERVKSDEDLEEEFARFEATASAADPSRILARFKRREYLRIMLRDVLGLATLADTTFEISQLADVLLRRALRTAEQKLEAAYGAPQFTDGQGRVQRAALTIFSLGKLGAQELNYASDIDIIFLYDRDGQTAGGAQSSISNNEYFVRLVQAVVKLITEPSPEGAVFRVDLRLRPQGAEGFVALSVPAAAQYYRTRAREWELQMLIKARPSAGNMDAGRHFLREVHPLVFRPEFNLAAVEAVLNARSEMTRSLTRRAARIGLAPSDPAEEHGQDYDAEWNVKLSPGGIRDIEFLTQCLQRLHGGADPWLASSAAASTLVALQRLHDKGHLSGNDFYRLSAAYQFLRKVEHRLQLRDGLQRHTLPGPDALPPGALDRLARRCGIEAPVAKGGSQLLSQVRAHFADVREIYNRLILPRKKDGPEAAVTAEDDSRAPSLLRRLGASYPAAAHAAQAVAATGDAFARRGLDRYLTAALLDSAVMRQLEENPGWVSSAGALFSRSDVAVDMLARHAGDIRWLANAADPGRLSLFAGEAAQSPEQALARLRTAYRQNIAVALAQSAFGQKKPFETFSTLTALAEQALSSCLPLALPQGEGAADTAAIPFAILALGRLGTGEMDFASDADLVFVADDSLTPQQREPWRRTAEQLIHIVGSQTQEGSLFPVDTRLRPGGGAGDLVVSATQLCDYLSTGGKAWEAATWLKARAAAGNLSLGMNVVKRVRTALADRWSLPDQLDEMTAQLTALRLRMESEGTGLKARGEFKHLPGGFYDIDYILSVLAFRCSLVATGRPMAVALLSTLAQIDGVQAAGSLTTEEASLLREACVLFRAADHAHRLVTGRPANRPPEPAVAVRMNVLLNGWELPLSHAPDALGQALAGARLRVRALYDKVMASR